jgi:hypothetical protein
MRPINDVPTITSHANLNPCRVRKTAKAIGVDLSTAIQLRADEVIE